ncbi:methyltransferase domain-containing protein [Arcanobacterium pinnipediorum]|uniref:Methyltransferase domain-containing protein n=1 Tax=Arcanobacterium pinnipediorum TaxID=1503041 RepID=A0ABY5AFG0_9ACTO|nr:methyltransferase domain-containing protein [Arcanobacterium pinnipediorum]USR78920.1 methyltransferase domain-containing protein [Arcanobacterium pinnipediorum]
MKNDSSLPQANRSTQAAAGHWVLARAGKKVLRPGGLKLTQRMLEKARLVGKDVVEFAPGLGRTAEIIVSQAITSYRGVDQDPAAAKRVESIVSPRAGVVINANAQDTGLAESSADIVVGEAMLTMQGEKAKTDIISEAYRLLRPGGRYAIHELGLVPDDIEPEVADTLCKKLAQAIRVNARPLTEKEWTEVLQACGFEIEWVGKEPMALLSLKRNFADEGFVGVLKILKNVILDKELRGRMMQMRAVFQEYNEQLTGIAIVARKPQA